MLTEPVEVCAPCHGQSAQPSPYRAASRAARQPCSSPLPSTRIRAAPRVVGPVQPHALVRSGRTDRDVHRQPHAARARIREGREECFDRDRECAALARFVRSAATLPFDAQSANPFVADGDHLAPPVGCPQRRDVRRDLLVGSLGRARRVEHTNPFGPRPAGALEHRRVARPASGGIVARGGSVFAAMSGSGLTTRAAVYASPVFFMRERTSRFRSFWDGITISFVQPRAMLLSSIVRGDEGSSYRSGSVPPFASAGPSLRESQRGLARTAAGRM